MSSHGGGRTSSAPGSHGRPDWDSYFVMIAGAVSLRGDCRRSLVGAVLVEDRTHRILSTGFNGTVPGEDGCLAGACPRGLLSLEELGPGGSYHNCIAKHAERNCLEYAQKYYGDGNRASSHIYAFGEELPVRTLLPNGFRDSTMYVTRKPCSDCESLLREAGVRRVVWFEETSAAIESLDLTMGGHL